MIDISQSSAYSGWMIRSFRHKGLAELWASGHTARIDARLHKRILLRLGTLDRATYLKAMDVPGFDFHALRGIQPIRYTIHVNGPWCITFEFGHGDVHRVDLEQYH